MQDAHVACRMMGYPRAETIAPGGVFGEGRGLILMDIVDCYGDETSLNDCTRNVPGRHYCDSRFAPANVVCEIPTPTTQSYSDSDLPYRDDERCGSDYLAPNGRPAECDPYGRKPCCTPYGTCGGGPRECLCNGCIDYRPYNASQEFRNDFRCGHNFIAPNGQVAKCDRNSDYPCCDGLYLVCGNTEEQCQCHTCVDYRLIGETPLTQEYRDDNRCGIGFVAPNGEAAKCKKDGAFPCCGRDRVCGNDLVHCNCRECVDYSIPDSEKVVRDDYRCGADFLAPNGEQAQCDPYGLDPCCSSHGYCGNSVHYCECDGCVDYRPDDPTQEFRYDFRCGEGYLAPNGQIAKCNKYGIYPCCSAEGVCGDSASDACLCETCIDYRNSD